MIRLVYSMVIFIFLILIKIMHPQSPTPSKNDNKIKQIQSSYFSDYHKKHTNPVWQIAWIEPDRSSKLGNIQILLSISSDGRITQWILRKEFEAIGKSELYHH